MNHGLVSFVVVMIKHELRPPVICHRCFRSTGSIFLLDCPIRAYVGSSQSLVHEIILSSSYLTQREALETM